MTSGPWGSVGEFLDTLTDAFDERASGELDVEVVERLLEESMASGPVVATPSEEFGRFAREAVQRLRLSKAS